MYSLNQLKRLPQKIQIAQLEKHGVAMDLAYEAKNAEAFLFSYNGFYIEMVIERNHHEIIAVNCFKSLNKLNPYLNQIDLSEVTILLSCGS